MLHDRRMKITSPYHSIAMKILLNPTKIVGPGKGSALSQTSIKKKINMLCIPCHSSRNKTPEPSEVKKIETPNKSKQTLINSNIRFKNMTS